MTISFWTPGKPAPGGSKRAFPIYRGKGSERVFTGRVAVTDAAGQANKDWRANVVQSAFNAMKESEMTPFDCAIKLELKFILPRPKNHYRSNGQIKDSAPDWHTNRPDAGKLARSTIDAMTGVCYRDDSQIAEEHATKKYGDIPGCEITISALT